MDVVNDLVCRMPESVIWQHFSGIWSPCQGDGTHHSILRDGMAAHRVINGPDGMNPFVRYAAGQLGIRDGACPRRWAVARKGREEEPVMYGQRVVGGRREEGAGWN